MGAPFLLYSCYHKGNGVKKVKVGAYTRINHKNISNFDPNLQINSSRIEIMMKRHIVCAALACVLLFSVSSCKKKEMFDEEVYNEILKIESPIDPIDSQQRWNLTTNRVATITVPASLKGQKRLMVLTDNPLTNPKTVIMAESKTYNSGDNFLVFAAPKVQTTFYAALEQDDGSLFIKEFTSSNLRASMSDATQIAKPSYELGYQTFTYCYEENYPEPGDYDFNDCVMRISVEPGDKSNQRKIKVTLVATGGNKLLAAAINILNYKYTDIESVETSDGKIWDDGYPVHRYLVDHTEMLLEGRQGEAVIRLFENASWQMVRNDADNAGALINYKVNVTKTVSDKEIQANYTTKTFIVTFKESAMALLNNFSLLNLDPFLVTSYNSGTWETHTYEQKHANILFEGVNQNSGNVTWALCIPDGEFRWPLEGHIIGTSKSGVITGAYREYGHAFGQWAANRNKAQDWYQYPTTSEVY